MTHRAFCDALERERSGRGITPINHVNNLFASQTHGLQILQASVKREEEEEVGDVHVPWQLGPPPANLLISSSLEHSLIHHTNPNPSSTPTSATHALLQRATQMEDGIGTFGNMMTSCLSSSDPGYSYGQYSPNAATPSQTQLHTAIGFGFGLGDGYGYGGNEGYFTRDFWG